MLKNITLVNVILIKKVSIDFTEGLTVFTGETGAGKSIILGSINLILGNKITSNVIRKGESNASITVIFDIKNNPQVISIINELGIAYENDEIIIRKVINDDGKSKNFINDAVVSNSALKNIVSNLIEIHGQFDNQKLLNSSFHKDILDEFAENRDLLQEAAKLFSEYKENLKNYKEAEEERKKLEEEAEFIKYNAKELINLNPLENEEEELVQKRIALLNNEKIISGLNQALNILKDKENIIHSLFKLERAIEGISKPLEGNASYTKVVASINKIIEDLDNNYEIIKDLKEENTASSENLDDIEERISDLRTIAKKHKVSTKELKNLKDEYSKKLEKISDFSKNSKLLDALNKSEEEYLKLANKLHEAREKAALILDSKVNDELKFLKLSSASFKTFISKESEKSDYTAAGINKIIFKVKTNLNSDYSDINKIASGGELSRFMLALKVVLIAVYKIDTIIFDEVDMGVGGEVAHAIGTRLISLSKGSVQVIAITHSHQIAVLAKSHYKVHKYNSETDTTTEVNKLDYDARIEEISRMISSDKITEEAKKTAIALLQNHD